MRRKLTLLLFLILSLYPIKAHSEEIVFNPGEFTWLIAKDPDVASFHHTYSIPNYWCFGGIPEPLSESLLCWRRAYLPSKEIAEQLIIEFIWSHFHDDGKITVEEVPAIDLISHVLLKYVYTIGDPTKLYIQNAPFLSWYIRKDPTDYKYESTSILGYVCNTTLLYGYNQFTYFSCNKTYK